MDSAITDFTSITNSSRQVAERYLNLSDGNLEQAMQLYFESGGLDLEQDIEPISAPARSAPARTGQPSRQQQSRRGGAGYTDDSGVVHLDSDDEMMDDDEEVQATEWRGNESRRGHPGESQRLRDPPISMPRDTENDEDIARRMQEELFAGGDMVGGDTGGGIRAPLARTTETLVGPNANWEDEPDGDVTRAVEAEFAARRRLQSMDMSVFLECGQQMLIVT